MTVEEAAHLLDFHPDSSGQGQEWIELGCGKGTFTSALARKLTENSTIHAIDTDLSALQRVPDHFGTVRIARKQLDFLREELPYHHLDGILMANSLHYVREKEEFLEKVTGLLKDTGLLLLVEYDTVRSNPWIPYPINFSGAQQLLRQVGFTSIRKMGEMPSKYRGQMYSLQAAIQGITPM